MSTLTKSRRPESPTTDNLEHYAHWVALALEKMPYFASILYALRPLDAPGLGTFAVDKGLRLYIDFDAVRDDLRLTADQCSQALLHECSHVWRQHMVRAQEAHVTNREAELANIAADAEINDDLVDAGCGWLGEFGIVPAKIGQPSYETYEFYLEALRKHVKNTPMCGSCGKHQPQPSQGQQGQPQPSQGQGDGSGSGCPECGSDGPYTGCGSISGGTPAPCELPGGDDAGGAGTPASDVEVENVLTRTADDIVQASKTRGDVPGALVTQARATLAPPQVPWQRVLFVMARQAMTKALGRRKATYTKRSRRRHNATMGGSGKRIVYPGRFTPKLRLLFVRDTSGSMSTPYMNALGNEVVGVARSMHIQDEFLRVMDVDTVVHSVKPYKNVKTLTEVTGRGGTNMCAAIEAAAELDPQPDVVVVGTDGFTPWPEAAPGFPVIACIVAGTREQAQELAEGTPDWMVTVAIGMDSAV